ncbi:MAG: CCA tRNA nucleotidyltransferase [Bdellovibrionales bacterium]
MEKLQELPWSGRPTARAVLKALLDADIEARFVGGCVRDAWLGMATSHTDLDMATPATPDAVTRALTRADIKAVPTGIEFGTITAVTSNDKIEITTLREDIETDGRHAVVKFGTDWEKDAARRDFTINALYADADGTLYDYFGGLDDIRVRRVRFIGAAGERIKEDYLRVLRFFRFSARFAEAVDSEGAAACSAAASGLSRLARERVWMELGKILALNDPLRAVQPMLDAGVLQALLPGMPFNPARLGRMADYEHDNHVVPSAVLRLAALGDVAPQVLRDRLMLSNRQVDYLGLAQESLRASDTRALKATWYRNAEKIMPPTVLHNIVLLLLADDDTRGTHKWPTDLFALAAAWDVPVFPLSGSDVLALGIPAGERVGQLLAQVEASWVENDFRPSRDDCLMQLKAAAQES